MGKENINYNNYNEPYFGMYQDQNGTLVLGIYADSQSVLNKIKSIGIEVKNGSMYFVHKVVKPLKVIDLTSNETQLKALRVLAAIAWGTTATNNGQGSNLLERINQEEVKNKYQNDIQERNNVLREIRYRMAQDPNYKPPTWVPEVDYRHFNINGVEPNNNRGGDFSDNVDFLQSLSNQFPHWDLNG